MQHAEIAGLSLHSPLLIYGRRKKKTILILLKERMTMKKGEREGGLFSVLSPPRTSGIH